MLYIVFPDICLRMGRFPKSIVFVLTDNNKNTKNYVSFYLIYICVRYQMYWKQSQNVCIL